MFADSPLSTTAALADAAGSALSLADAAAATDVGSSAAGAAPWAWLSDFAGSWGVDVSSATVVLAEEEADGFSLFSGVPFVDVALPLLSLAYATASPGVIWGAIDTFVLAPVDTLLSPRVNPDDVKLSRRIGDGSFGQVYIGTYQGRAIIAKKPKLAVEGAEQLAFAEEYFNSRLRRSLALRRSAAPYLGSYRSNSDDGAPILMWEERGTETLATLLEARDFVGALDDALELNTSGGDEASRTNKVVKAAMRQLLSAVKELHEAGIVHRDLKPSNIIAMRSTIGPPRLRIVDFGAAADMRTGINYEPKRGLLDPSHAPPEQLVMPESTPPPPAAPVAALLSPFLWAAFRPDLFDAFSIGLILVQLCVPALRRRNSLGPSGTFQRSLAAAEYDLRSWRKQNEGGIWDFQVFDAAGGLAWDLACKLVCKRNATRRGRLSCAEALLHPWFVLPV
jgi:serine/threonine protein kinase